jgi:hypothetical protein
MGLFRVEEEEWGRMERRPGALGRVMGQDNTRLGCVYSAG